jgi:hypothetical protein
VGSRASEDDVRRKPHYGHEAVRICLRRRLFRRPSRPAGDPIRARLDPEGRLDPSGPAANTRASTPQKGKGEAPSAAQPKPKVDKGKAKVVDTGKPTKAVYPIMTGGDFKIREPKVPTPPSLPINPSAKKGLLVDKPEKPPRVARALQLLDEEGSPEAGGPAKDLPGSARKTYSAAEESVEAVEAPLVKRRKLTKAAGEDVPVAGSAPWLTKWLTSPDSWPLGGGRPCLLRFRR